MATPRKYIQDAYRARRERGIRLIRTPVGYGLLDYLQNQGYLPPHTILDWPLLSKADVEDALRRYLKDQASEG